MIQTVFSTDDVKAQLHKETELYLKVSAVWKSSMELFEDCDLIVINVTESPGILEKLSTTNTMLVEIIKGLHKYAEEKKIAFPR